MRHRSHPARALAAALAVATLTACNWGTRPERFAPALGPEGASVAVRVRGEAADRKGELMAVDSTGIVLRRQRLERIAWPRVAALDVDRLGREYDVPEGETVSAEKRARLALVSRFPQGLRGDVLARVLAALGQSALDEVS